MAWKKALRFVLDPISRFFKRIWNYLLGSGPHIPVSVINYTGYGFADRIWLKGRILRERSILPSDADHSTFTNFINAARRFNSNKIHGATIDIQVGEHIFEVKSDQEGYFTLDTTLPVHLPTAETDWLNVSVSLKDTPGQPNFQLETESKICVPQAPCFGIISDIDDTIIESHVTSFFKVRMLYLTLLKNALTRVAFGQASAFYRALQAGPKKQDCSNPFFYVSNSPWNLYDLLEEFLTYNQFPMGPILLRDFGIPYQKFPKSYKGHKYENIANIVSTYQQLPFILIGDSAEKDADIYLDIARAFPERIKVIFIRDILHPKRAARIGKMISQHAHIPVHLVPTYKEAAIIAGQLDLMDPAYFTELANGHHS